MKNTGKETGLHHQSDHQVSWNLVQECLEKGRYARIVELLQEAQARDGQVNGDYPVDMLATAKQICLIVSQCQEQVEWHRQAAQEADQQAQALRQQLWTILALINGQEIANPDCKAVARAQANGTSPAEHGGRAKPSLKIESLGAFRVTYDGRQITNWSSLKARSIFKYMLAHQGAPIAKDILMDVFWPEADPEAARRNLHQAIYTLRQILKQEGSDFQPIQFENDHYLLNPELNIWLDYAEFEHQFQTGQRLEAAGEMAAAAAEYRQAIELYQGDFLEEDLYEDWPMLQREYLRSMYLDIADRLSEYYMEQDRPAQAIAICQKILAQDNCHEEAHRRLMQCYLAQDQRRLALRQYERCVQKLKAELDVAPAPETKALYQQIVGQAREMPSFQLQAVSV